jgi:peptidyl-prolyl cis-trans isomerase C
MLKLKYALPFLFFTAWAQAQPLPQGSFALVNGQALSDALLDLNIQANIARGQTDSPQLRQVLQSELIGREVLAQESKKLNLDQTPNAQAALSQMQQNFLTGLLLENFARVNPVTEAQIKADYEIFKKEMTNAKEYKLSIITIASQKRAQEMINELQKKRNKNSFSTLAKAESIDPSKDNGGELDWLLRQQIQPAVGNVVANLSKGGLSTVPIQTQAGWIVVQLDDVRTFSVPTMKDIEPQLRDAAAKKALAAYVQDLRAKAKVIQ